MVGVVWAWRPCNRWNQHRSRHRSSGIIPAPAITVKPPISSPRALQGIGLSAIESDVFEGRRRSSSGAYWSKQGWRTDHRVYIAGGFASSQLTPLEEVYAPKISTLPYVIQEQLRAEFWDSLGAASWEEKNSAAAWIEKAVKDFVGERLDVAYDFEEIEQRARRCAEICRHIPTYEGINEYAESKGVDLPSLNGRVTERGCVNRARTSKWWRRKLARLYRRAAEGKLRASGFVRRRAGLYCSNFAVSARRQQAAATDTYLRERRIVSAEGEQLELFDVWQGSVSNPAIRRAELMTRMRGFEEIAKELGHVAEFITLTCPSEYHAINSDGRRNSNYRQHSVRDAQAWLNKMWARARAKLKKAKVLIYGFRIAEPHHDGTPHWHMVLFCASSDVDTLRRVLTNYWLSESGSEPGAAHHRIKFEAIDPKKGSATGYISKYIAKNIDGFEVGQDYEAETDGHVEPQGIPGRADADSHDWREEKKPPSDASNTAKRVGAWASLWGIRQFQQIGGPQVTIYRECRRIREPTHVVSIERARVPADAGDWAGFTRGVGGVAAGRKGTLSLWTEVTGECNQYDEAKGPQLVGIMGAALYGVETHQKTWRVVKVMGESAGHKQHLTMMGLSRSGVGYLKPGSTGLHDSDSPSPLGPVSITVAGGLSPISAIALKSALARSLGETYGWTNPQESSMYGPN
jgi:hypothetical protein